MVGKVTGKAVESVLNSSAKVASMPIWAGSGIVERPYAHVPKPDVMTAASIRKAKEEAKRLLGWDTFFIVCSPEQIEQLRADPEWEEVSANVTFGAYDGR